METGFALDDSLLYTPFVGDKYFYIAINDKFFIGSII